MRLRDIVTNARERSRVTVTSPLPYEGERLGDRATVFFESYHKLEGVLYKHEQLYQVINWGTKE